MAQKLIVDCTTGEQSVVDLTDEEEAARSAAQVEAETENAAAAEAAAQAATDKASGNAKLKALGLTDEEIAALVG